MSNLKDSNSFSSGKSDPAATDLNYYSQPENYTGSNLTSLQKFIVAKDKEEEKDLKPEKKKVVKDAKYQFYNRYKHILQGVIFVEDLQAGEAEESSEESDNGEEEEDYEEGEEEHQGGMLQPISEEDEGTSPVGRDGRPTPICSARKSHMSNRSVEISTSQVLHTTDSPSDTSRGSPSKRSVTSSGATSRLSKGRALDHMSREEIRSRMLIQKFRDAVTYVKVICRLNASARSSGGGGSVVTKSGKTFLEIANDGPNTEDKMRNAGLSFDPSVFKAKREISLSSETKTILSTPSSLRTLDQVHTAMLGLQCLRSFAEYPLHMQEKLAKVAWYEVVAPKRVIIRQGHFAENFYFVLSGHAVVTILLQDPKTGVPFVKTAAVIKKGMSFGELALLHRSKRTATVISQDQVQLLTIGREDFFDIFMSGQGPDNVPDHVRFISNLDFMKGWPIQELLEHPEEVLLHFYKRNTLIVADSKSSEWMYIVKSGSCQVLKKLKGVTANARFTTRTAPFERHSAALDAIVFAPKVDTWAKKGQTPKREEDEEEEEEDSEASDTEKGSDNSEDGDEDTAGNIHFSKEQYTKNPATGNAHFKMASSYYRRKQYEPPESSKPKKQTEPAPANPAQAKSQPVFVQVQNLKPRDVFGLDTVVFDDDYANPLTSVCLVSRGAECVMLKKAFYIKHATYDIKKSVRQVVRQYPAEEVFQENLQIKTDWAMFKKVLLGDITSDIREKCKRL